MFVIRNVNQAPDILALLSWRMWSTPRGRRIGSRRLPDLRGDWICCEARGLKRQIRGRRIHSLKVPGMRRKRTQTQHPAQNYRLTQPLEKSFGNARPTAYPFGVTTRQITSIWFLLSRLIFDSKAITQFLQL